MNGSILLKPLWFKYSQVRIRVLCSQCEILKWLINPFCTFPFGLNPSISSTDGVPFLMHDHTLRRTTDVGKIFPDRQLDDASFFNWTDLQQLNAGHWFIKVGLEIWFWRYFSFNRQLWAVISLGIFHMFSITSSVLQDDPFWTVNSLSLHEKKLIANQSVCSLEQLLKLASYHNSTVVFRLRRPPPDHPCYHSWINDTLQAVQQSGVPQSLVSVLESSPQCDSLCISQTRFMQQLYTVNPVITLLGWWEFPISIYVHSDSTIMTLSCVVNMALHNICAGDVDTRWAKSSGETARTWSDPDFSGETESSKSQRVWNQQTSAQIQPGQRTGNQVGTHTWPPVNEENKQAHTHYRLSP